MKLVLLLTYCLMGVLLFLIASSEPNFQLPVLEYGLVAETQPQFLQNKEGSVSRMHLASVIDSSDSILFVGDVLLARNVELLTQKKGSSYPYEGIRFADISNNPFVVGNFESSIPKVHSPTKMFKMNFSVDAALLPAVRQAGFTHFSLANNHSFDYGQTDFIHTKEQLISAGFETFGHPSQFLQDSITFLTLKNTKVSLMGLNAIVQQPSLQEIENVLDYASSLSEFQIVYVHWGTEYSPKSNGAQQELAKQLVASGADMIIGHHPHVVQEIELINGVPVFYSLGNYIFDQYFSIEVQEGLILNLVFGEQLTINLIPVTSENSLSQPNYMEEEDSQRFLRQLSNRSDGDLKEFIQAGVLPLNRSFATSSKMAIMK